MVDLLSHSTPANGAKRSEALTKGSIGHRDLVRARGEGRRPIVEKRRFSAFIQGSSELDKVLKARGIDNLLITGTVTGVCCESTARDAMMLNYQVTMVTDGNASYSDEEHNRALTAFYSTFGDIMSTDELIALMARTRRSRRRSNSLSARGRRGQGAARESRAGEAAHRMSTRSPTSPCPLRPQVRRGKLLSGLSGRNLVSGFTPLRRCCALMRPFSR